MHEPASVDVWRPSALTLVLFVGPALLIFAGFTAYPVARTFYDSVHIIGPGNDVEFVGLGNFIQALTADDVFWTAVKNTALFTLVATPLDVFGGLLLALCLYALVPVESALRVVW